MKQVVKYAGLAVLTAGLVALAGCTTTFGTNPSAPNGVEKMVFQPITNLVPVTLHVTNVVPVTMTNYQTVTVPVTNLQGVTEFRTNQVEVPVTVLKTNTVTITNLAEAVTLEPKAGAKAAVDAGGAALNAVMPGVGTIVSSGVWALVVFWGYLRSSKLGNTANALAQEIEAVRTFIKTLPNGPSLDAAITAFLQNHQLETGVVQQVLAILEKEISNPDAAAAAKEIGTLVAQLK